MLNIGWSEMLIVAAIALIVVGPKDLPAMLRQLGRVFGTVRRMGNEFKSEINKVAALDEVKDIKNSITKPLEDTNKELTEQFNAIGKDGKVEPTGAIKPSVEGQESVADEIRESAGMASSTAPDPAAAASSMKQAIARAEQTAADKAAAEAEAKAKPAARKKAAPRKRAAAKTSTKSPAAKKPATKKPAAKKAPAKRAATKKPAASKTTAARKPAAKKPAAAKTAAAPAAKPVTAVANKGGIPAKTAAKLQRAPKGEA